MLIAAWTALALAFPAVASDDDPRLAWWREARFGLFIHWGLYAVPAGSWKDRTDHGEWIRETAQIPIDEYDHIRERFDPVKFDAKEWARIARDAGMGYVVITSKHHDGFCLFDSKLTDFDVASTPFRRDILKELSEAVRKEGLEMCWYHSIMDWHHPDYLPRRGWEQRSAEGADFSRFVGYLHGQVEELLTNYGKIGVMWFDGEWESTWNHALGKALYEHCRRIAPAVIVNNRVDKGRAGMAGMTIDDSFCGDFGTPEQEVPATGFPGVDWESCITMNDHWGFNARDDHWKSEAELIRLLVDVVSKGGNLLLNVGPQADGTFPQPCIDRLAAMGRWMKVNGTAIHGTTASPFAELPFGRCTAKRAGGVTHLYLHVFDWPADGKLRIEGLGNDVASARLLASANDSDSLAVARQGAAVEIAVPEQAPDPICSVIDLAIDGEPVVYLPPRIEAPSRAFVTTVTVVIAPGSGDVKTRYTLDGSDPTPASPRYATPLVISESTSVRAQSYLHGRAVSAVAAEDFEKWTPRKPVDRVPIGPGLKCTLYRGDWNRLPDFGALRPETESIAERVALPPAETERFGCRFDGFVKVPRDELWRFSLSSDDGARLWVEGILLGDLDGLHTTTEVTGEIALAAGLHPIRIDYFNKTGDSHLALKWAAGSAPLADLPPDALAHD